MKTFLKFFTAASFVLALTCCNSEQNSAESGSNDNSENVTDNQNTNITVPGSEFFGNPAELNASSYAEWAGCRSSPYGMEEFPDVDGWATYVNRMASFYKKSETQYSTGALVWIVGVVESESSGISCQLNFPEPSGITVPVGLAFSDEDENEEYLDMFDAAGFDVWLQVESGFVDVVELAKIVMNKYKHHKCVKGFGIDVEWYQNTTDGNDGTKLDDTTAKNVDNAVKDVNSSYSVFVKHYSPRWLPPKYRGKNNDMIFVTDSQYFDSFEEMAEHYTGWAEKYAPNPVFFQIGYEGEKEDEDDPDEIGSDERIWREFNKPLQAFGQAILDSVNESENQAVKTQKKGIIWVDFTFEKAYGMSE